MTEHEPQRPRTRGDCINGPRPCPWYGCRYHLGLDVTRSGRVIAADLDEMTETCALDVADRGGITLDEVGALLVAQDGAIGVTKERVRQIERLGLAGLRRGVARDGIQAADLIDVEPDAGAAPVGSAGGRLGQVPAGERVLAVLRAGSWRTSADIAASLGRRTSDVGTDLLDLFRAGLVTRVQQGRVFAYALAGTTEPPPAPPAPRARPTPLRDRVFDELSGGEWLSAEAIARRLGSNRQAVNGSLHHVRAQVERRERRGAHGGRFYEYRIKPKEDESMARERVATDEQYLEALQAGPATASEIGEAVGVSATTARRIMVKLEALGRVELVERWGPRYGDAWRLPDTRAELVEHSTVVETPPGATVLDVAAAVANDAGQVELDELPADLEEAQEGWRCATEEALVLGRELKRRDEEIESLRAELGRARSELDRYGRTIPIPNEVDEPPAEVTRLPVREVAAPPAGRVDVGRREELVRQTLTLEADAVTVERALRLVELFMAGEYSDAVGLLRVAHRQERAA